MERNYFASRLGVLMAAFVLALPGCGGAVTTEAGDIPETDASVDGQPDLDSGDEDSSSVIIDTGAPEFAPYDAKTERPPWNGKCLCRNWSDTHYPTNVYYYDNCVQGPECPAGTVCCAGPCVSTDICEWRQGDMDDET